MNAKEANKIPHLSKLKTGRYKYQRKVPKFAQEALGKKPWDISLGSNYGVAVDKARAYAATHDDLLAQLTTPADQENYQQRKTEEIAAMMIRLRPGMRLRIGDDGQPEKVPPMDRNPGHWMQTGDKINSASTLPPKQELQHLAYFAAFAFGDRNTLDLLPDNSPMGDALVDVLQPQRPNDPKDANMYDAMKAVLDARIQEVGGVVLVNPKHTLTHLHKIIAELRNTKPTTIENHMMTTTKFLKFLRDEKGIEYEPSIATITDQLLQEYLDYLLSDPNVKNTSIEKYFDGMKSVFRHAIKTKKVPGLVVNPVDFIELPKSASPEEIMYLPFDKEEMRRIWEEVHIRWGPENRKSKLSAGRRRAFLMCFRVLLYSGLRPTEFYWLRDHGEVTSEYIFAARTKTDIKRYIPLSEHVKDFHAFVEDGGFEECIFHGKFRGEDFGKYNARKLHETMRRGFFEVRNKVGISEPRKVLYSTKDTLLQRLRGVDGYTSYIEVVVTGHVKKLEMGRRYGGVLGDSEQIRAQVKKALDQITYP